MNAKLAMLLVCGLSCCGYSQGFVNLDFEDAVFYVPPTAVGQWGDFIDPSAAFPGWTVGGNYTTVAYNNLSIGGPAITLMGPEFPNGPGFSPLEGSYSVFMQYFNIYDPPTLSQTAMVPAWANSITFLSNGPLPVTMNDVYIPISYVGDGRYAGNISSFAGEVSTLTFTTYVSTYGWFPYFDDIFFSTSSVPEPSVFSLVCLGLLGLGWHWRRKRR